MIVYADILLIINFLMDYFSLWAVNLMLRKKKRQRSLIMGAIFASISFLLILLFGKYSLFSYLTCLIAIPVCSTYFAFKPPNFREQLKINFLFIISTVFIGGFFSGIYNALQGFSPELKQLSFGLFIVLSLLCYISIKLLYKSYQQRLITKQTFVEITLKNESSLVSINALVDTGNTLHEPFSGKSVIVAEKESIIDILPKKLELCEKIKLIPYSSVGKERGFLFGIEPESVEIQGKKVSAVIGIMNNKISNKGEYQALISPELLKGEL